MPADPTPSTASSADEEGLWPGVVALVEGMDVDARVAHGLAGVAAPLPAGSSPEDARRLTVERLLARSRYERALASLRALVGATDERVVLFKGVEAAQRWPDPTWRVFMDLDVLARAPQALAGDVRRLGYREQPGVVPDGHHHLAPMVADDDAPLVEIHLRPGWPTWMDAPPTAELLERAVPAVTPVPGLWALDPVDHCLVVAVHHWADGPFRRARDLVDVAALRAGLDEPALAGRAEAWGIGRLWSLTCRCVDALFGDGRLSIAPRLVTGPVRRGRVRGPVAHRAGVYLADFLVTSPARAGRAVVHRARHSDVVHSVGR